MTANHWVSTYEFAGLDWLLVTFMIDYMQKHKKLIVEAFNSDTRFRTARYKVHLS